MRPARPPHRDWLTLSRTEFSELGQRRDPLDLRKTLAEVVDACEPQAELRQVSLDLTLPDCGLVVGGEPGWVGVLFTNRSQSLNADGAIQTLGADAAFTFYRHLTINTYVARTRTEGRQGDDASYRGDVQWAGDRYGFEARRKLSS